MDIAAGVPLEATPFLDLLETFKLNNKDITIDELTNIIDKLDPSFKVFQVEQNYTEDFRKLVLYELEERVKVLFQKITTKIIDKKNSLVNKAIAAWEKDPTNTDHITKIGTFKIDINFDYIDKMTLSHKLKSVSITYGELLTKYKIFKNAIESAFAQSSLIQTQSEFLQVFFNNAITTLGMRVSTARDLFDTAGVSAQCEAAHKIDWPSSSFPEVPERFTTTYPLEKRNWKKYCYICGFPINNIYGEPSQCEHILPVFQACTFNCLIQGSTDINTASALRKALYKLEYAGSHACCNILKSNNSFIIIDPTKNPPIQINYKYIIQLISLIISKSKNQSDSLECSKLHKGLILLGTLPIDFIAARAKEITDDYLMPLVKALNMTLELNKSNQTYATSGIISLFLLLNQFISFEPAIEQTIIGILTGGSMTEKSKILFYSYATATFITNDLIPIITDLEQKGQSTDNKNYLDIIGFILDNPSYDELLDRLLHANMNTNNIRLPRNLSKDSDYKFLSIKDLMSHFAIFYINKNFLNTNNYDDFLQMINPEHFIPQKYPNNIANNLLELKIKNFFSTLLKQFYPYDATQSSFSKREELSLLEFCKAYIGLEFVYIIIYYLHKFHKISNEQLEVTQQVEFFTPESNAKIQTCFNKYKAYYMKFVTDFFIYQSIHILSTSSPNSLTLDQTDGKVTETQKKNTIIHYSGQTYYDILELLSINPTNKSWFDGFIDKINKIIQNCGTEAAKAPDSGQWELQSITTSTQPIASDVFNKFIILFDTDEKFKKILTIYNVGTIGSAAFRNKIINLPDKDAAAAPAPAADDDNDDAAAMSDAAAANYDDDDMTGGVREPREPVKRTRPDPDYLRGTRQDITRGIIRNTKKENIISTRRGIEPFITELKKINKTEIIDELQTRSSRSETIYKLRPAPTQVLPINLGHNISRLVINETDKIYICIYIPAYILAIHRCILIDTYFLNKIVEMIDNEYVFSNGELLDTTDTQLLETLIQKDEADNRVGGSALYNELFNNSNFFSAHADYLPLFEKCNLFLYYDTADNSVRDIYDNKLYASKGGTLIGGKKYYKKITKKLKNKKIVKKTKEKLKTKSRKHKSRKHKSRKHKSRKHKSKFTKTLKKKI